MIHRRSLRRGQSAITGAAHDARGGTRSGPGGEHTSAVSGCLCGIDSEAALYRVHADVFGHCRRRLDGRRGWSGIRSAHHGLRLRLGLGRDRWLGLRVRLGKRSELKLDRGFFECEGDTTGRERSENDPDQDVSAHGSDGKGGHQPRSTIAIDTLGRSEGGTTTKGEGRASHQGSR